MLIRWQDFETLEPNIFNKVQIRRLIRHSMLRQFGQITIRHQLWTPSTGCHGDSVRDKRYTVTVICQMGHTRQWGRIWHRNDCRWQPDTRWISEMENTSKALVMEISEKKGFDFLMLISIYIKDWFILHDTNTPRSLCLLL